ncbi:MAG: DUF512 domain-containing protein [Candidatus Aegiribacteria sp.]
MLRIESVGSPSPASAAGLRRTDILISCNGHPVDDFIDFLFAADGTFASIEYTRAATTRNIRLRRLPGSHWGLTFRGQTPRVCGKKCVFCFVDQLPPGVRPSLRVKDDDIRYSFLQGTYVTLSEEDVAFAVKRRLSPVHVSVHATDPRLRGRILGTGRDQPVMDWLNTLSRAGIEIETQVVAVPGLNDGHHLERTAEDLLSVEGVRSVGVVPAGLTRFREGLPEVRRPTAGEAADIIDICHRFRARAAGRGRGGWIYPSDELFLLAGRNIPPSEYYRGCTLRENGIGMLSELPSSGSRSYRGGGIVCTGSLAAPFIRRALSGSDYLVKAVENRFLGEQVGVAGLISGSDVARTVSGLSTSYNRLILPSVMFNHEMITIDDQTPGHIERATGMKVVVAGKLEELD